MGIVINGNVEIFKIMKEYQWQTKIIFYFIQNPIRH